MSLEKLRIVVVSYYYYATPTTRLLPILHENISLILSQILIRAGFLADSDKGCSNAAETTHGRVRHSTDDWQMYEVHDYPSGTPSSPYQHCAVFSYPGSSIRHIASGHQSLDRVTCHMRNIVQLSSTRSDRRPLPTVSSRALRTRCIYPATVDSRSLSRTLGTKRSI